VEVFSMAPDVLDRLRAADPAARMPEQEPAERERLRRVILTTRPEPPRPRRRWRPTGRTLAVLLGGAALLAGCTAYATHLALEKHETAYTLRSGTWQRLPLAVDGGEVLALVGDPKNPATLYAGTPEGLFKSTDGAASWKRLQVAGGVYAITVDPRNPSHLFVSASAKYAHSPLLESRDGGASWSAVSRFPYVSVVGGLWIDPSTSPSTVYAAGHGWVGGFFRSGDGGKTWSRIETGVKAQAPEELAIDPAGHMLYAAYRHSQTKSVLVCSSDGGATWHDLTAHLPAVVRSAEPLRLSVDPADTSHLYLSARNKVLASNDRGRSWSKLRGEARDWALAVLNASPGTPASAVREASVFLSRFEVATTADGLTDASSGTPIVGVRAPVVVDPHETSTLYLATAEGVYKSSDEGATWFKASAGIKDHAVIAVLPDNSSPSTFLALTRGGLVRSTDGGHSYVTLLPTAVTTVLAAPSSPSTLYATTFTGVLRSSDGGTTWSRPRHQGLPAEPGSLDLALVASDRPGTVFVNVDGSLFRSTDGGRTWRGVEGLPRGESVRLLLEVPGDPATLFAAAGRLYRSTDSGRTWTTIGGASWGGGLGPLALAIDPHSPSRMLITTEKKPVWHRSTDGGKTWHDFVVREPATSPEYLVFDPRRRHTVYAVTGWDGSPSYLYAAVYRSTDGGSTWEDISWGLPDPWPNLVVAPDGALYAATEAGLYTWVPSDK
jgi:photosystem II stability/assembly factor-like uncharacterized protein